MYLRFFGSVKPYRIPVFHAAGEKRPDKTCDNHDKAQYLPGRKSQQRMGDCRRKGSLDELNPIANRGIRLAEIFDNKADKPVTGKIHGDKKALERLAVAEKPDNGPEENAFKNHLVKLGRVAGKVKHTSGANDRG